MASRRLRKKASLVKILFCWQNLHKWLDGVQVKNISEKAKNTGHWSEFLLHKNFKLVLDQNLTKQTYHKISCRSQIILTLITNQQFHLLNWTFLSNMSRNDYDCCNMYPNLYCNITNGLLCPSFSSSNSKCMKSADPGVQNYRTLKKSNIWQMCWHLKAKYTRWKGIFLQA